MLRSADGWPNPPWASWQAKHFPAKHFPNLASIGCVVFPSNIVFQMLISQNGSPGHPKKRRLVFYRFWWAICLAENTQKCHHLASWAAPPWSAHHLVGLNEVTESKSCANNFLKTFILSTAYNAINALVEQFARLQIAKFAFSDARLHLFFASAASELFAGWSRRLSPWRDAARALRISPVVERWTGSPPDQRANVQNGSTSFLWGHPIFGDESVFFWKTN